MTSIAPSEFVSLRVEDDTWNYRGEFTKGHTHGFHSYPAMMIPQVARRLIGTYSSPGSMILDPFCGSGSVLVEARASGRSSIGIDLNPLALLISKVKTTVIDPAVLRSEYRELMDRIAGFPLEELEKPDFFNLDFWFKPDVIRRLTVIRAAISATASREIKDFFLVAFSEAVRLSSNSRSREFKLFRYSPERLEKHNPDADAIFRDRVEANIKCMERLVGSEWFISDLACRLIHADTTQPVMQVEPESVDAVITSPPYGDSRTTVAYGQFSRLSTQWLGLDDEPGNLDTRLMGGKPAPDLNDALDYPSLREPLSQIAKVDERRAKEVLSFYKDLGAALANIAGMIRHGGYLCFVTGNRRVKRVQLPTDLITAELGVRLGLTPEKIILRRIPNKRMPLSNSPTNVPGATEETMSREYIVVMRK